MSAMVSAHEDFVREIDSRPDDDTPRLVYADWLEDRADLQGYRHPLTSLRPFEAHTNGPLR